MVKFIIVVYALVIDWFSELNWLKYIFYILKRLAVKGIYPAIDPLDSTSTMFQPWIVGEKHYETVQRVKQTLQRYKELQDIIAILDLNKLFKEDCLTVKFFFDKQKCHQT